ncbi:hypothetical protein IF1G_08308 [Cordyceps javanica]|uniref:Uncharacterized protein n=1 Tax=Cordyceps javanica TaxID=43265 RepID=A0A545VT50_9HYPO|nr:hypothetical protein IF1G_08308 [Cordyceps javanica]TQW04899.1 hypothetical protein IF2G_07542 [Cordyceps javanica]
MRLVTLVMGVVAVALGAIADDITLPSGVAIRLNPVRGSGYWDIAAGQPCSNLGILKPLWNQAIVAPWAQCRLYQHLDCYDELFDHRLGGGVYNITQLNFQSIYCPFR